VDTPGTTTKDDQSISTLFDPLGVEYGNPQDLHTMLFDDPLMGNCSPNVGCQILDVQGKLKAASQFWVDVLHASSPVLDWIQEGYKLPLVSQPPPFSQPNHKSAIDDLQYVCHGDSEGTP